MRLRVLEGAYVVEHDPEGLATPAGVEWLWAVRAPEGLTVVRAAHDADGPERERWRALYDAEAGHGLDVPGLLAAVVDPLAAAGLPVFACSTYHADLVLVPAARVGDAAAALQAAGHELAAAD